MHNNRRFSTFIDLNTFRVTNIVYSGVWTHHDGSVDGRESELEWTSVVSSMFQPHYIQISLCVSEAELDERARSNIPP